MPKEKQARFYKRKEKPKSSKLKDWTILFLTLILAIYALSLVRHLTLNEAKGTTEAPINVRIQVLNGCGQGGLAEKIRDYLISQKWGNLTFDVVDVNNFNDQPISHTLILDRKGENQKAIKVADVLGVSRANVLAKKLEDNYLDIDVTLVVGTDYPQAFKKYNQTGAEK